ncbi:MAG: DUF2829 domain-containing protein [Negativicutes bacterium]|nr:DUF2829 domain-containing protein [Negativicutes bacterium]
MERHIGVKIIHAEPMTAAERKTYFPNIKPSTEEEDGYKVVYPDGYESWSPKSVFDEAYRKTEAMTFGLAVEAMRKGLKVSRAGWNGKGMWAVLQKGYPDGIHINKNTAEATGMPEGTLMKFRAYFMLFTAQGDFAHWVPSGSDILAEDWEIVE